jgi:tetratricopeptide (TPR) repeat protein
VPAARAALATSLAHRQAVAGADPASARAKRALLQTWGRQVAAARKDKDAAAARAAAENALELAGRLAAADPISGQAKRDLAAARGAWGLALSDEGQRAAPLTAWLKALDDYEELAARDKESLTAQEDVGDAAARLADVYTAARLPAAAMEAANRGLAVRRAVAAANPDNRYAHRNLMRAYRAVGDIHAQRLQLDEADKWYAEALRVAERFPNPAALAAEVAVVKEQRQVCKAITAGMAKFDAVKAYPNPVLARALVVLLDVYLERGKRVEAAAAADLLASAARGPEDYYSAARGYAGAAFEAQSDDERRAYATQAVKYLKQAADAGFRDASRLDGPPWDAIRADPAFGPLVESIRSSAPAARDGARR